MSNAYQLQMKMREFVRVYPQDDGESIQAVTVFPMCNFSVPSPAFERMAKEILEKTNKVFEPENPDRMHLLINYYFNAGFSQLDTEGRLITAENQKMLTTRECAYFYDGQSLNYTDDGFTTFVSYQIPITPADKMQ